MTAASRAAKPGLALQEIACPIRARNQNPLAELDVHETDAAMDQFLDDIRRVVRESKNPDVVIAGFSALLAWMIVLGLRTVFGPL
jgi:hypothetical protein